MLSDIEALTVRMKKLEQQNQYLRLAVLGIALAGMIVVLIGADKTSRTVEAEKIVLLDRNGHAKVTIGTPALTGATVDANPDEPVIWLSDEKGTDRAMLTIGGLFFANGKAKPTASLSSDSNGASSLKFYGTDGKVSWSAPRAD
jgi:hypothetical protein